MVRAHQGAPRTANWVTKSRFRTSLVTNKRDDTAQVCWCAAPPTVQSQVMFLLETVDCCNRSLWCCKVWQPPQPHRHHQLSQTQRQSPDNPQTVIVFTSINILADFFEPPLSYQKTFISTFIGLTLIDCCLSKKGICPIRGVECRYDALVLLKVFSKSI